MENWNEVFINDHDQLPPLDQMCQVVEVYIEKAKGVRVNIIREGVNLNLLEQAYRIAVFNLVRR